ncbi:MAG: hypothetical protein K9M07_02730 [Simkaniaceae bacterium]|nr:hypothetical protein [Simkaniaceae bacterium]
MACKVIKENEIKTKYEHFLESTDSRYLSIAIEKHIPFESELQFLEDVTSFTAFKGYRPILEKMASFMNGIDLFKINEENKIKVGGFSEISGHLKKPVLINTSDLKRLLVAIEGGGIDDLHPYRGRPDLFFKHFALKRCKDSFHEDAYEIDFTLIKRDLDRG